MTDELDAAVAAARQVRAAERQLARGAAAFRTAALAARAAGVSQADLARATGYSRERLRQLERAAERSDGGLHPVNG